MMKLLFGGIIVIGIIFMSSFSNVGTTLSTSFTIKEESYFSECLKKRMNHNATQVDKIGITKITRDLILFYTKFVTIEPVMAPNASCTPVIEFDKASCAKYPTVFTGPREKPVKVASIIQLGFDVDTLEIHLHELNLGADRIFIIESTWTHLNGVKKPLVWEMISHMPAFIQFKDKVVHLIIDDVENTVNFDRNDMWSLEHYQEMIRFDRFLQWNNKTKEFGPDDIIGFGDADEIASFKNILLLKHCHFHHSSVDIGTLFYMGSLNRAFMTDWPVPGHGRLFLGDPTYFTIKSAIKAGAIFLNSFF